MNITGIVAEYNPYHNGHQYMTAKCREAGATHLVAVMSGNFVQRGSVAIMDKRARAKAALADGVDLVLELPVPWAVSTAELFARGGLSVLAGLGCVQSLAFGCETADKDLLEKAADAVCDIKVHGLIKEELEGGITYAAARENAVRRLYGDEIADVISKPNNILAVEYLKAMKSIGTTFDLMPIERRGAEHDSLKENGEFSSASALRIMLERGDERAFEFMPEASVEEFKRLEKVGRAPVTIDDSERAILSRLRMLTVEDIKKAPDISEGLENRIYNAIQSATSLEELYSIVKTKRYTHSRIRRIVTALYLGITPQLALEKVPYVRVLGFNEQGREILKLAKDSATLPIIMKSSQTEELTDYGKCIFDLECKATNLYNLATPRILPCGTELTDEVIMI
ncbi:MAG: nucleotidyltransferase family protein [Clostridia bacterium]|nr:nucleotidyltransferase family protein [Clostridia bacterium]MBR6479439.1 nucleotidyltransferase family protein [Clostridia bacterium]